MRQLILPQHAIGGPFALALEAELARLGLLDWRDYLEDINELVATSHGCPAALQSLLGELNVSSAFLRARIRLECVLSLRGAVAIRADAPSDSLCTREDLLCVGMNGRLPMSRPASGRLLYLVVSRSRHRDLPPSYAAACKSAAADARPSWLPRLSRQRWRGRGSSTSSASSASVSSSTSS
jgi:hypothetical protein